MAGKNPSMLIRVAATIAELKANLAEGKSQIETTTAAMAKLATSLSGEKLIQSAHNITAAVNQIGGASKLTDAEAARVNATLTRALEKYASLGKEAPAAMVALAEATKQVEKPTVALSVAVGVLAAQLVQKAASALTDYGKEALLTSARVESLGGVARFMGQQAGFSAVEINALVEALRRQGITSQAANNAVIQMVRANLSLADATQLATVAQSLARATGENSSATLTKLIQGVQTLQVEVLRNAGVVIQLDQEYKKFAETNNRTVQSISAQEKQQIALAAVLREGERVAGVYGVTNEFVGGKIQSMTRHQEEAAKAIGDVFKPALRVGVDVLTEFLKVVQAAPALFGGVGLATIGMATAFTTFKGAAALGVISTTTMTTALGLLWPAVAIGATAFAAWNLGRWIGEFTTLTDIVERIAGRMKGLSSADIEASMSARKYAESAEGKNAALKAQVAALESLDAKAKAAEAAANALAAEQIAAAEAAKEHAEELKKAAKAAEELERSYAKLMSEVKNANQLALMEDEAAAMKQNAEQAAMFAEQDIKARIRRQQAITDQAAAEAKAESDRIAANQAEIDALLAAGKAHQDAGAVAKQSTDQTIAGYAGIAQQVTITGDAVKEWINLMAYTAKAQAVLSSGSSLFTTQSQRERLAQIPSFASGVENFAGGVARVHRDEMLVNLPRGTSVVPAGGGSNITIAPVLHFHGPVLGSSLEFDAAVSGALLNVLKSGAISIPAGVG